MKQVCAICGQPVTLKFEGAQVSHMACVMEATKETREKFLKYMADLAEKQRRVNHPQ